MTFFENIQTTHKIIAKELTQWAFVTLGSILIHKNSNLIYFDTKTSMNYYFLATYINTMNNELEELGMVELNPVKQLMMKSEITKPAPSPQSSTNLHGNKICKSSQDIDY